MPTSPPMAVQVTNQLKNIIEVSWPLADTDATNGTNFTLGYGLYFTH